MLLRSPLCPNYSSNLNSLVLTGVVVGLDRFGVVVFDDSFEQAYLFAIGLQVVKLIIHLLLFPLQRSLRPTVSLH